MVSELQLAIQQVKTKRNFYEGKSAVASSWMQKAPWTWKADAANEIITLLEGLATSEVVGERDNVRECDDATHGIIRGETINALSGINPPRIVCLCGSVRFADVIAAIDTEETLMGRIVLSPSRTQPSGYLPERALGAPLKAQCDRLHRYRIQMADEILVLNVNGYIGASTRAEIEYATALGKAIRYLEPTTTTEVGEGKQDAE